MRGMLLSYEPVPLENPLTDLTQMGIQAAPFRKEYIRQI
jgi:hypothetical protein